MREWQVSFGSLVNFDDSDEHQRGDFIGMAGERYTKVRVLHPFGFSSAAPQDARGALLYAGSNREVAMALAMESREHRPRNLPAGATVLYGANGEIVSLVGKTIRIKADTIVLEGTVKLGGDDASRAVSLKDSLDDAGNKQIGNLATKVFGL